MQKLKALREAASKLPRAVGPKKKFPFCSRGPTRSLGPGGASPGAEAPADGDSRVLPVDPALEFAALNPEAGPAGWAVLSVRYGEFGCPLPAAGAQQKEFGGLLSLEQDLNCFREAQVKC